MKALCQQGPELQARAGRYARVYCAVARNFSLKLLAVMHSFKHLFTSTNLSACRRLLSQGKKAVACALLCCQGDKRAQH